MATYHLEIRVADDEALTAWVIDTLMDGMYHTEHLGCPARAETQSGWLIVPIIPSNYSTALRMRDRILHRHRLREEGVTLPTRITVENIDAYDVADAWRAGVECGDFSGERYHDTKHFKQVPWKGLTLKNPDVEPVYPFAPNHDKTLVGFFKSGEDVCLRRPTYMSVGRFIQKFYAVDNDTTERLTQEVAALHTVDWGIEETSKGIAEIYMNGPNSCMARSVYDCDPHHPTEVYGDGSDIKLLWVRRGGRYTGRCLVWPDMKFHGRVYGDCARVNAVLLEQGYEYGDFDGARLNRIEVHGGEYLVAPYLDGEQCVRDCGDFLVIEGGGEYCFEDTYGMVSLRGYSSYCERCEERVPDDALEFLPVIFQHWCESCVTYNTFYCRGSDTTYPDSDYNAVQVVTTITADGYRLRETWEEEYARDNATWSETEGEWFGGGIEMVCLDYIDDHVSERYAQSDCFTCPVDGELYLEVDGQWSQVHNCYIGPDADLAEFDGDAGEEAGDTHRPRQGRDEHPDQGELPLPHLAA